MPPTCNTPPREHSRNPITGRTHPAQVALRGMIAQGDGHIYNVKGLGSGGQTMPGTIPYGIGKHAVSYITKALRTEAKSLPVTISTYSPGIVKTELLIKSIDPVNPGRSMAFLT